MNTKRVTKILKEDEGFRGRMYLDTRDIPTIGYGFNLRDGELPEQIAAALLAHQIDQMTHACAQRIAFWAQLPDQVQNVLVCLAFNLGIGGLLAFKKTLKFLEMGNYRAASEELLRSRWAHQVSESRSQRMANLLRTAAG
jgi:lysozyme